MKRLNVMYWAAVSVLGAGLIFSQVSADGGTTPGSVEDPVVTKSYVDEQIAKALAGAGFGSSSELKLVTLNNGQKLIGVNGTEIIIRGGRASAIAGVSGGLSDVTAAGDIPMNGNVPTNHHIIVPKNDGRGITAQENNTYVLVRGEYTIQ